MGACLTYARQLAIAAALAWLGGCSATLPEGVFKCEDEGDCPSGFACRRDDADQLYCFRRGSMREAGSGAAGSEAVDGGTAGKSSAGRGGQGGATAGSDAGMPPVPVAPTTTGFGSLGGARKGAGIVLRDEAFETLDRRCSSDGHYCATGGFAP